MHRLSAGRVEGDHVGVLGEPHATRLRPLSTATAVLLKQRSNTARGERQPAGGMGLGVLFHQPACGLEQVTQDLTGQARTGLLDGAYLPILIGRSWSARCHHQNRRLAIGPTSSPVESIAGSARLLGGTGTVHPGGVWIQVGAHVGGPHITQMLAVVVGLGARAYTGSVPLFLAFSLLALATCGLFACSSDPAPERSRRMTRIRYRVLAWLCSLSMITYIDRVCISTAAPAIRSELDLSPSQMAWIFSAFSLAYAAFEEVVASDRSSGRPYQEATDWRLSANMPDDARELVVALELGGTDARYGPKLLQRARPNRRNRIEGTVVEDNVGGYPVLPRYAEPPLAQRLQERACCVGCGGLGFVM